MSTLSAITRAERFADSQGCRIPIFMAPMAGACPPSLAIAVAGAGGLGACGALLMSPPEIKRWAEEVRAATHANFQMNLWIPDPSPPRDSKGEDAVRAFMRRWGPAVPVDAGDHLPLDFAAQCEAILEVRPAVISSIMGLYPPSIVSAVKSSGMQWYATATTVAEAVAAEQAGADVIVVQGMEAGGHRGCFDADQAELRAVGLFSLLPAVVDAVSVPVVATGGIADARGVAAALLLGASAVQIGTGFLRCPEAQLPAAWVDALAHTRPEQTTLTRAFSGRAGRSIDTAFVQAARAPDAPRPAPYPVQRGFTGPMRKAAARDNDIDRMQAWAGQSAALARAEPAGLLTQALWDETLSLMAKAR